MDIKQGRQAVWTHAQEVEMDDFIRKVSAAFPDAIDDVAIYSYGRLSYVNNIPPKVIRVPALPVKIDSKAVMAETRRVKR